MNNKKIANYCNTLPRLVSISSDKLISGVAYQRAVKNKAVMDIVNNFSPMSFTPPLVNIRNGQYILVDGQHRVSALVYMNGNKPLNILCIVYEGATLEDEADTVAKIDKGHRNMTPFEIFQAELLGSSDESRIARSFFEACMDCGVSLKPATTNNPNEYVCISTLKLMFVTYGESEFKTVMQLLDDCWHGREGAKKVSVIKAVFKFNSMHKGKYSRKRAITAWSKESCDRLLTTAKGMTGSIGDNLDMLLLNSYNHGLPGDKRL